jgi:hypothetical protein
VPPVPRGFKTPQELAKHVDLATLVKDQPEREKARQRRADRQPFACALPWNPFCARHGPP